MKSAQHVRRVSRVSLFAAVCLLALPALASEAPAAGEPDAVLATVAGVPITAEHFTQEMERRGGMRLGRFATAEQRMALLDAMVHREALLAAAIEAGYDRRPDILEATRRLIVGKYREDLLDAKLAELQVSDDEAAAYYRERPEAFTVPGQLRAAVIRVSVPAAAAAEKRAALRQKAEEARRRALEIDPGIPSFGGLAVEFSDDQASRYRGGDAGPLTPDSERWEKAVMDTAAGLREPGDLSGVVATDRAFYVVKLIEARPGVQQPLAEVRDQARHFALAAKKKAVEDAFFKRLTRGIDVNTELLETLIPHGERPRPAPLPDLGSPRQNEEAKR